MRIWHYFFRNNDFAGRLNEEKGLGEVQLLKKEHFCREKKFTEREKKTRIAQKEKSSKILKNKSLKIKKIMQ